MIARDTADTFPCDLLRAVEEVGAWPGCQPAAAHASAHKPVGKAPQIGGVLNTLAALEAGAASSIARSRTAGRR